MAPKLRPSDKRQLDTVRQGFATLGISSPRVTVQHSLFFPTKEDALAAAADAAPLGWEQPREPKRLPSEVWSLLLEGPDITLTEKSVAKFRQQLTAIASRHSGSYEQWGVHAPQLANQLTNLELRPLEQEEHTILDILRDAARDEGIAGDLSAMESYWQKKLSLCPAGFIPDQLPMCVLITMVAAGDWLCQHTGMDWAIAPDPQSGAVDMTSFVLRHRGTGGIAFIFDSIMKRYLSHEPIFGFLRAMVDNLPVFDTFPQAS